jgi:hypothetical protein
MRSDPAAARANSPEFTAVPCHPECGSPAPVIEYVNGPGGRTGVAAFRTNEEFDAE